MAQIEIEIEGKTQGLEVAIQHSVALFGQLSGTLSTTFGILANQSETSTSRIGSSFTNAFTSILNSSNLAFNVVKKGFMEVALAAGATSKEASNAFNKYFGELEKRSVVTTSKIKDNISSMMNSSKGYNLPSANNSALVDYYKEVDKKLQIQFESTQKKIDNFFRNATSAGGNSPLPTASTSMFEGKGNSATLNMLSNVLPFGLGRTAANIGASFPQLAAEIGVSTAAIEGITAAIAAIPAGPILAVVAAIGLVTKAAELAKSAITNFIVPALDHGIKYNDLIENTTNGFAGLIMQMTDVYNGQTKLTSATDQWTGALAISDKIVLQLQNSALKTKSTFVELARGMQEGLGPMLQAGITEDKIAPFVTRFTQGMNALRIPMREIGQEMRSFFNMETNPRTARMGFFLIGQAAAEMGVQVDEAKAKLKAMSGDELNEWFMKHTQGMEKAGEESMKTLSGYVSNIKDYLDRFLGVGTKDLYNALVGTLDQITEQFVSFDAKGNVKFSEKWVEALKNIADAAQSLIKLLPVLLGALDVAVRAWNFAAGIVKEIKFVVSLFDPNGLLGKLPTTKSEKILTPQQRAHQEREEDRIRQQAEINAGLLRPIGNSAQNQFNFQLRKLPSQLQGPGLSEEELKKLDAQLKKQSEDAQKLIDAQKKKWDEAAKAVDEYNKKIPGRERDNQLGLAVAKGQVTPQNEAYMKEMNRISDLYDKESNDLKERQKILGNTEAISKATTALSVYRKELEDIALVDYNKAIVKQMTTPIDISKWEDKGPYADYYAKFLNQMKETGKKTTEELNKSQEQFEKKFSEGISKDLKKFAHDFADPLGNLFEGIAKNGGKGFMEAAASNFDRLVADGATNFADIIAASLGFGGKLTQDDKGNYLLNGQGIDPDKWKSMKRQQDKLAAGMAGVNIALGGYAQGRSGAPGSITGGVIGGGVSGASIGASLGSATGPFTALAGGIVGAIIGAIVGGLSAAMGKAEAREEYKYGTPQYSQGKFSLSWTKNMNKDEIEGYEARIQDTFDKFWNGYMNIAIKYGATMLPKLQGALGNALGQIQIQPEASKNFLKHLEEWITTGLPDSVMQVFKPVLTSVFTNLGMTVGRFNTLFNQLGNLDPSKTLELLGLLADSLDKFNKLSNYKVDLPDMISPGGPSYDFNWMIGLASLRGGITRTFDDARKNIADLATGVQNLTGEQQIRAVNDLATALTDMFEEQKRLAEELNKFLVDSSRSFDAYRRNLIMENMGTIETDDKGNKTFKPDYQAQADYLKSYMDKIIVNIGNAKNMDELQYWQNEFFKTSQEIGGIYKQMGPEAYKAFTDWMIGIDGQGGVAKIFQDAIQARIHQWGEEITSPNDVLMTQIQPIIETFKGVLVPTGTDVKDLGDRVKDTTQQFRDLIPVIGRVKDALDQIANPNANSTVPNTAASAQAGYESRVLMRRLAR